MDKERNTNPYFLIKNSFTSYETPKGTFHQSLTFLFTQLRSVEKELRPLSRRVAPALRNSWMRYAISMPILGVICVKLNCSQSRRRERKRLATINSNSESQIPHGNANWNKNSDSNRNSDEPKVGENAGSLGAC